MARSIAIPLKSEFSALYALRYEPAGGRGKKAPAKRSIRDGVIWDLIESAGELMSFKDDNAAFEDWLREQCARIGCEVVEADLEYKHDQMTADAFVFLRATFFRWAKRIEALLPDYATAPPVLSVGDTHVENFGTWRDNEGRLVWGVNDFDEAAVIPYPFDLVRLVTSIRLARLSGVSDHEAAAARERLCPGACRAAPHPT
jgi:aminoglycoside phosphotransferase (APT) family kinase protein